MTTNWTTLPLEDCMAAIIDYRGKSPQKTTFGVPLVTAKIIKSGRIEPPEEFIAEADYEDWMRRGMPEKGDVVMTTEAPLGEVAQLDERKVALAQRVITLRGKPNVLDNTFLKFLLQWEPTQAQLRARSTGTTVLGIRQSELRKINLTLPPLPEQKAIAAVLGALDDKIELNRRMNATLEAMARALFQSWFVDFDPVRAKLDSRPPTGLDPATAALFPNEFEDSELGPIPKGWEVGSVEDILTFSRSTIDPSKSPDELFAHYSLPAFDEGRIPKLEAGRAIKSQKLVVPPAAVLLSKLNPHIPRIWLPDVTSEEPAVCSTEFLVSKPKSAASREYLFCLFVSDPFASEYSTLVTGTTGSHQRVRGESVLQMKIVIPPAAVLRGFSAVVKPVLDKVGRNVGESVTLAALRDALLPKLLAGKIRTPIP